MKTKMIIHPGSGTFACYHNKKKWTTFNHCIGCTEHMYIVDGGLILNPQVYCEISDFPDKLKSILEQI